MRKCEVPGCEDRDTHAHYFMGHGGFSLCADHFNNNLDGYHLEGNKIVKD